MIQNLRKNVGYKPKELLSVLSVTDGLSLSSRLLPMLQLLQL